MLSTTAPGAAARPSLQQGQHCSSGLARMPMHVLHLTVEIGLAFCNKDFQEDYLIGHCIM